MRYTERHVGNFQTTATSCSYKLPPIYMLVSIECTRNLHKIFFKLNNKYCGTSCFCVFMQTKCIYNIILHKNDEGIDGTFIK